ncbi:MAG: amino acid ABC transporter permease [Actinomycetota bacterium]
MKTEPTGAEATRPPLASEGGGRRDRLAMWSAGIPFRLKVGIVWGVIFLILAGFMAVSGFDFGWMFDKLGYISAGLQYTLIIAISGIILAIILALLGALGRLSRNPIAYGVSGFYTSFFRGTPLIVQMFLMYLALPQIGINLTKRFSWVPDQLADILTLEAVVVGVLALGLNYGAYMTEIFRAGIQSVGHGQGEAADALGMSYGLKMRRVVLPQAFRVIIPPTGNEFIAMMKDTALVSFLGITAASAEIFRRAQLVGKAEFKNLEAYLVVAGLYWILTAIFTFFQSRLERRMSKGYVRHGTEPTRGGTKKKPQEAEFLPASASGGSGGGGAMIQIPQPGGTDEGGQPRGG